MPDEGATQSQGSTPPEGQQEAPGGLLAALGLRKVDPPAESNQGGATPPGEGQQQQQAGQPNSGPQEPQGQQLGDAGLSALEKEREARREAEAALKRYTEQSEFEKAQASRNEREKLEAERDRFKSQAESAESTLLRVRVAAQKNLSPGLALRLQGSTEAEMIADADRLLEEFKSTQPRTGFDGGAREPAPQEKSPEQAHTDLLLQMLGRSPDQST